MSPMVGIVPLRAASKITPFVVFAQPGKATMPRLDPLGAPPKRVTRTIAAPSADLYSSSRWLAGPTHATRQAGHWPSSPPGRWRDRRLPSGPSAWTLSGQRVAYGRSRIATRSLLLRGNAQEAQQIAAKDARKRLHKERHEQHQKGDRGEDRRPQGQASAATRGFRRARKRGERARSVVDIGGLEGADSALAGAPCDSQGRRFAGCDHWPMSFIGYRG